MIEVRGIIQPSDYVRAQYLHMRPRPLYKVLGVFVSALVLWAAWIAITDESRHPLYFLYPTLLIALILNFTVYVPWKTRRIYGQQKALQRELTFKFDESGALITTENGQTTMPWSDYLRWKQNNHLMLIYLSDCMYHMLPRRLFVDPDGFEKLGELLTNKIGRKVL